MRRAAQLPLDLGHRPAFNREDFLVAASNETAVAWVDRWPDWPGPALALYGPPGSGKSHLCQVWRQASGAVAVEAAALAAAEPLDILGQATACAVEGIETAVAGDPLRERRLLHLYNLLAERGGHLLATGRSPPVRWPCALPDLASRLAAASAVALAAPDDSLIAAVLVKQFHDRQLRVAPGVVHYLLPRMERSFAAIGDIVAAIDRAALAERRSVTVTLVRRVLEDRLPTPPPG